MLRMEQHVDQHPLGEDVELRMEQVLVLGKKLVEEVVLRMEKRTDHHRLFEKESRKNLRTAEVKEVPMAEERDGQ